MNPKINITKDPLPYPFLIEDLRSGYGSGKEFFLVEVLENNLKLQYYLIYDGKEIILNKSDLLILHGVDEDSFYPSLEKDGDICSLDPYLKEEHFKRSIEPYGIRLKEVKKNTDNFIYSHDWTMSEEKESRLRFLIKEEFKKRLS